MEKLEYNAISPRLKAKQSIGFKDGYGGSTGPMKWNCCASEIRNHPGCMKVSEAAPCKHHPGIFEIGRTRTWSCCDQAQFSEGCLQGLRI